MSQRLYLGVDIGTYETKGVLVKQDGKIIGSRTVESPWNWDTLFVNVHLAIKYSKEGPEQSQGEDSGDRFCRELVLRHL